MTPFTVHTGTAVPLRRRDVDTDQIIPSDYLKRVTRTGFEDGLFAQWRSQGAASGDPFVLDRPERAGASVLIAGEDFGTGSSREHAVWALQDWGFRAVISPRFADIFRGNAPKNGLLPVVLPADVVERLWELVESDPKAEVTIDLERREVRAGDVTATFEIDEGIRWRLLNGFDDIGLTLRHDAEIAAYEAAMPSYKPTTTVTSAT
ncbi:MAG TPA: 3-isopropylmalate dehydratase small subunit [Mycobacteriales bacterium]|nr:3-isopropylmalate dehydratase small subunit [Mycobacteriales bacterium]